MKVQLFHNRVVMVTTGVEINLAVFFKGVDVVEHKERLCGEDAHAVTVFLFNNVKSGELVSIPVKPLFKTGGGIPVRQNSPYIQHKWNFSDNNIILGQTEAVKIPETTRGWDTAKHFTPI